jgi:DnaJ homolog subfamily B member 4
MGASPRSRSTYDMDVDDDDDDMPGGFSGFSSFGGGMPGGMPGRSQSFRSSSRHASTGSKPSAPAEITRPLKVSLEDLYNGAVKHLKIGRRLLNGTTEEKVLDINIQKGWKSGTKVRFPKAGNEQAGGEAQDLVFVVEEKPHDKFTREGNDLVTTLSVPLLDALTGSSIPKIAVDMLDGRKVQVPVPSGIVKPGQKTTIVGEGMPIRKDGAVRSKGDLIVNWNVIFPERLTASQKEGLKRVLG